MLNKKNFYIDGKWVVPIEPRSYKVIDPSNEEPCAEISLGGKEDIDKAVSVAKKAFSTWAFSKKEERLELLEKIVLSKLSKKLFFSYFTDIFFPITSEALLKKGKNNKG